MFIVYFWETELLKQQTKPSEDSASSLPAGTDCCCWHVFLLCRSRPAESEEPPCLRWVVHPIQSGLGPGVSSCPRIQTHLHSNRWDTVCGRWSVRRTAHVGWKFVGWMKVNWGFKALVPNLFGCLPFKQISPLINIQNQQYVGSVCWFMWIFFGSPPVFHKKKGKEEWKRILFYESWWSPFPLLGN